MATKYGSILVFWNPATSEMLAETFTSLGEKYGGVKPAQTGTLATERDYFYPGDAASITMIAATNDKHPAHGDIRQYPTLQVDEPREAVAAYKKAIEAAGVPCVVTDLRDKDHPELPAGEAFCIEFEDVRLTLYPNDLSRLAKAASATSTS